MSNFYCQHHSITHIRLYIGYVGHLLSEFLAIYAQQTYETLDQFVMLDLRRKRISRKPPRPTTLDPRLHFFIVFFYSLFIKFGKQYQVNVGSPSATLA